MSTNNATPSPLPPADFATELRKAAASGDYAPILQMAKMTSNMLQDFRDALANATVQGRDVQAFAMGISFVDQLIAQSSQQIKDLTLKVQQQPQPPQDGNHA